MYQQLLGYKVEEKLYLGVREQKRLNTTELDSMEAVTYTIKAGRQCVLLFLSHCQQEFRKLITALH
jgi:hypothetical protein